MKYFGSHFDTHVIKKILYNGILIHDLSSTEVRAYPIKNRHLHKYLTGMLNYILYRYAYDIGNPRCHTHLGLFS